MLVAVRAIGAAGIKSVLLVLAGMAFGATAMTAPPAQAVIGVVLNGGDSRPVEGAFVVLEPVGEPPECDAAGVRTGRGGRFEIPVPLCQQFKVMVQKPGFLPFSQLYQSPGGNAPNGFNPGRDEVRDLPSHLELRIVPHAVIAGRVTDPAGQPLTGAVVQLSGLHVQGRRSALVTVTKVTTNDLGEYRMFGLTPGRYYVGAFFQDQGSRLGLREASDRNPAFERATEDYAVTYYPWSPEVEGATVVRARGGQVAEGIDIQVQMRRSFTVAGVVAGLPAGVKTPMVFLEPSQYGGIGSVRYDIPAPDSPEFEFRSVSPGTYTVRTEVNLKGRILSARQEVNVGSEPSDSVVLDLKPPFTVTGVISTGGGRLPPDARLRLSGLDRRFLAPIEPDAAGRFEVRVVGPDRYLVDVVSDSGTAYIKSVTLDSQAIGPDGEDIGGPGHVLRVLVSNEAGRIEGTAVDSDQQSVSRGLAILVNSSADKPSAYTSALGAGGSFEFRALPPGRYRLSVFSDLASPGDAAWDVQRRARTTGELITISASEQRRLTVEVRRMDPL